MKKDKDYLLRHDFTPREIGDFLEEGHEDFESVVIALWKEAGLKVVELCKNYEPLGEIKVFLDKCTACGGDWGQMLLTGIKEACPDVYEAIPDNMGSLAFVGISSTLHLLGVNI